MLPVALLGSLAVVGTIGFVVLENFSVLDALYMTIITISTVGFREVGSLSDDGKIFTILIIVTSLGLVAYYVTMITRLLLDGEWQREYREYRIGKKLRRMKNHVIVCGYGRNGHQACAVLKQNGLQYAVIEQRNEYVAIASKSEELVIPGDATRDEVLLEAGIEKAKAIITALPSDADNLFVVVSAKQLNPAITIISRVSDVHTVSKIKNAGASHIVMPDKLGGAQMAAMVMKPDVVEFINLLNTEQTDNFQVSELAVNKTVSLGSLDLWKQTGCTVLGIRQLNGEFLRNPQPDHQLAIGEQLIVMGSDLTISRAKALL